MKASRVVAGLVAATVLIGTSLPDVWAGPPRKPLGKMTCADFLGLDDAVKPEIVYWAAIHGQGGRLGVDVIDVGETDRVVPLLVEQCKGTPSDSFWKKVRAEAERFEKKL